MRLTISRKQRSGPAAAREIGSVIEFRSVVDAVRCAIEVQDGMIERNSGLPPERRIEFRVGIHLGDIVEESDGDLMGDGVNIADRLEGIAAPGAICLLPRTPTASSRGGWNSLSPILGPTQLKNIAEPVRVYALQVAQVRVHNSRHPCCATCHRYASNNAYLICLTVSPREPDRHRHPDRLLWDREHPRPKH